MTIAGTTIGMAGAWIGSRFLTTLLYGVRSTDALTFVLAPLLLLAVAAIACLVPVRRATNVSPMIALRYE